jgi:hypothetical protein
MVAQSTASPTASPTASQDAPREWLLPLDFLYQESEFNAGTGACGPTALAVAGRWTTRRVIPTAKMMLDSMVAMRLCTSTGVTNLPNLEKAARNLHYPVQLKPSGTGVLSNVLSYAASVLKGAYQSPGVCIFECTNGQALRDYLSGTGEDASGLRNHILALVGFNYGGYSPYLGCTVPEGYFACDGDSTIINPIVGGKRVHRNITPQLCYYTYDNLNAAKPYDVFSIPR